MSNHVMTVLCPSMGEVASTHLERLRTLRDEGFIVHICASDDKTSSSLAAEGFVLRRLPAPLGIKVNVASWVLCWAHLVENPPTVLHGFGYWSWTAALAAQRLDIPVTCVSPGFTRLEWPSRLPKRFQDAIPRKPADAYRWMGAQVDRYLVDSEAELTRASEVVSPSILELIVGSPGVVLPNDLTFDDRLVVVIRGKDSRSVGKRILNRLPRMVTRGERERPLEDDLNGATLYVETDDTAAARLRLMVAAAHGIPAVCRGITDIVLPGRTGLIAADLAGLSACATDLLEHPKLRTEMSVSAHRRAQTRFSRANVDDQLIRIYERTLRRRMGR